VAVVVLREYFPAQVAVVLFREVFARNDDVLVPVFLPQIFVVREQFIRRVELCPADVVVTLLQGVMNTVARKASTPSVSRLILSTYWSL
jgi:hypothetical protein